ncbi:MAG: hypothetical protein NC489_21175 [Ruminococcus flavefaciens]|nr:hypothetical protein [Ruminococcus flavefaciens]
MKFKKNNKTHDEIMKELAAKYKVAKAKNNERKIKREIFKLRFPFKLQLKFNKLIVLCSIVAIIAYTVAAILLQKYTQMELSPTLTTCVYAFFGTELLSLAGIKVFDTKFSQAEPSNAENNIIENDPDAVG